MSFLQQYIFPFILTKTRVKLFVSNELYNILELVHIPKYYKLDIIVIMIATHPCQVDKTLIKQGIRTTFNVSCTFPCLRISYLYEHYRYIIHILYQVQMYIHNDCFKNKVLCRVCDRYKSTTSNVNPF